MDELATLHVSPFIVRSMTCARILPASTGRLPAGLHPFEKRSGAHVVYRGELGLQLRNALACALDCLFGRFRFAFCHWSGLDFIISFANDSAGVMQLSRIV